MRRISFGVVIDGGEISKLIWEKIGVSKGSSAHFRLSVWEVGISKV